VAEFLLMYFITGCLGITLSYHRQLTHRSFTTPKWLERVLAYCGVMAVQGDPLEWVSCHRYHHLHCETPLDPHSVYEGFWWSHMGWLLDDRATQSRVHDTSNATGARRAAAAPAAASCCFRCRRARHQLPRAPAPPLLKLSRCQSLPPPPTPPPSFRADISRDPFYAHLSKHYGLHVVGMFVAIFLLGGLDSLLWAGCLRCAWVYHITWFVNSAAHVWGTQEYETGGCPLPSLETRCCWLKHPMGSTC
jgi:stearoyl-CoA desaturase (delta-9 desaturase)